MKNRNAVKRFGPTLAGVGMSLGTTLAMAQTNYDAVVAAADWTDVGVGVGTIGAALGLVLAIVTGVAILLSRLRGK